MRCSFCDTDGHPMLTIILVPAQRRGAPSPTADPRKTVETGGACDACLPLVAAAQEINRSR